MLAKLNFHFQCSIYMLFKFIKFEMGLNSNCRLPHSFGPKNLGQSDHRHYSVLFWMVLETLSFVIETPRISMHSCFSRTSHNLPTTLINTTHSPSTTQNKNNQKNETCATNNKKFHSPNQNNGFQANGFGFTTVQHPPPHNGPHRRHNREESKRTNTNLRSRRKSNGCNTSRRERVSKLIRVCGGHARVEIW